MVYAKFRPYLMEFLDYLSERFELIVYCKGSEIYCAQVLDKIESKKCYFSYRIFGNHVLFDNQNYSVKYYEFLFNQDRNTMNTIIVDLYPETYCLNLFNGIPISGKWDDTDSELPKLAGCLEALDGCENVFYQLLEIIKET